MLKIGFIGAQSFHAQEFASLINKSGVIDARVTHIWAEPGQEERVQQLSHEYEIPVICKNYTDMIGKVDAVMLLTRNGADHVEQAKPFLNAQIPVWVDKPIALDSRDAEKLCALVQKSGMPLMGGSTLKHSSDMQTLKDLLAEFKQIDYFSFSYCSSVDAPTGGVSFYGIHLAEIICYLFGDAVETITAKQFGKTVTVLLQYKGGMVANLIMTDGGYENTYNIIGGGKYAAAHINCQDCYAKELEYMYNVLTGQDKPLSPIQFTAPVKLMHAIEQAL